MPKTSLMKSSSPKNQQEVQKVCPARPQREGGEAYRVPIALQNAVGGGYVELPNDARTKLAGFFNILPSGMRRWVDE